MKLLSSIFLLSTLAQDVGAPKRYEDKLALCWCVQNVPGLHSYRLEEQIDHLAIHFVHDKDNAWDAIHRCYEDMNTFSAFSGGSRQKGHHIWKSIESMCEDPLFMSTLYEPVNSDGTPWNHIENNRKYGIGRFSRQGRIKAAQNSSHVDAICDEGSTFQDEIPIESVPHPLISNWFVTQLPLSHLPAYKHGLLNSVPYIL